MRHVLSIVLGLAFATAFVGCRVSQPRRLQGPKPLSIGCDTSGLPLRLAHGDWMVSKGTHVWKVLEDQPDGPPKHVGYLVGRDYRQMRGGPTMRMYTVTSLNRRERLGSIDEMGHAHRYEPVRNGGFQPVDVGTGTLEESVAAIFQTIHPITLEQTSERRIAFDMLDKNHDGVLGPDPLTGKDERAGMGDRLMRADKNGDGVTDFEEFNALDVL
jgi:hypothetical protein